MNPPRGKPRGITERGFAPITAGGIHPRGKPRGIEPSRLKECELRGVIRPVAGPTGVDEAVGRGQ